MPPDQEELIYDALNALTNCSQTLCLLAYQHGTYKDRNAYQEGLYAAAVILQIALGDEALARGKARYEAREAQAAFAQALSVPVDTGNKTGEEL
jgi:hypothetical protein